MCDVCVARTNRRRKGKEKQTETHLIDNVDREATPERKYFLPFFSSVVETISKKGKPIKESGMSSARGKRQRKKVDTLLNIYFRECIFVISLCSLSIGDTINLSDGPSIDDVNISFCPHQKFIAEGEKRTCRDKNDSNKQ